MSAVRMVAYGVLELKHKTGNIQSVWARAAEVADPAKEQEEDRQRNEIRKLVNDELRRYGLLIQREAVANKYAWHTKANAHVLYGQQQGPKGFLTREVLKAGDFKECCIVAAQLLDQMELAT